MFPQSMSSYLLGCPHLHRNAKSLEHLRAAHTDNVQSHNLLLGPVTDELVSRGALMLEHGVVHGGESGLVDLQTVLAILRLGLWLCEPDGANLWVCEDYGWDVGVVQPSLCKFWPAEEAVGEAAAGGNGDCYVVSR